MKVALIQLNVGPDSADNLPTTLAEINKAAAQGAKLVITPEGTNYLRSHTSELREDESESSLDNDPHIPAFAKAAKQHGIWLMAGSLLLSRGPGEKKLNRQFLWNPQGELVATYDKIHMFDVNVPDGQTYRESAHYEAGSEVVISDVLGAKLGHAICYDLRFPALFQTMAKAGAELIVVPAAFTAMTGALHWHALLRARAIENGAYVLAAGQTGTHDTTRNTYGHSLIIAPDGKVIADAGEAPGIVYADLDLELVAKTRAMIPNLQNERPLELKAQLLNTVS